VWNMKFWDWLWLLLFALDEEREQKDREREREKENITALVDECLQTTLGWLSHDYFEAFLAPFVNVKISFHQGDNVGYDRQGFTFTPDQAHRYRFAYERTLEALRLEETSFFFDYRFEQTHLDVSGDYATVEGTLTLNIFGRELGTLLTVIAVTFDLEKWDHEWKIRNIELTLESREEAEKLFRLLCRQEFLDLFDEYAFRLRLLRGKSGQESPGRE